MDDLIVSIATFVVFAHSAADYAALANGLGLPWTKILREDNVHSLSEVSSVLFDDGYRVILKWPLDSPVHDD